MFSNYLIATVFLVLILALWVAVQIGWRGVFNRRGGDPDVLAGRMGCGGGCDHHEDES
jgi:hypothetical protein